MKIAGRGWPVVIGGALAGAAGFLPFMGWSGWLLAASGFGLSGFSAYFFRDPDRPLPEDSGKLYAPGDGRVLSVGPEGSGDGATVRIFLSVFDVHVQRNACSGIVDRVRYQPGGFALAMAPEAALNERNLVRITPEGGRAPVAVEQIAGFLARRIECWAREGDRVRAGERYGMIYFGSQVAVHLPPSARPLVRPGDRVTGGVTEIGEWIV